MKSIEWIDMLIKAKSLPSDRQAALMIGMGEPLMSKHRCGKAVTLDDKYAYRLEELLELPHGKIVLDQHAEREKDPNISAMWRRLAGTAAGVALALLIGAPKADANNSHEIQAIDSKEEFSSGNIPAIVNIGIFRKWRKSALREKLVRFCDRFGSFWRPDYSF